MKDIAIIGCGVIGAACAYALSRYDLSVVILEKSNDVANGTSKANSGIVHAGYDPLPGTGMARLNIRGNELMGPLCERLDVPFKRVGSHVLALSEADLAHIKALYDRGVQNGVPGLELLSGDEVRAREPAVSDKVVGSLYAPTAGIVSPWELTLALAEVAVRNGAELRLCAPVEAIRRESDGFFTLATPKGEVRAKTVIDAAGVSAAEVCSLLTEPDFEIEPNRGEYYLFDKSEGNVVRSVIFRCPGPEGKGVLVSPTVHGNLIVGPNAEPVEGPEHTENTAAGLAFLRERAVLSVPGLRFGENIRNFAGVRANHKGDDFIIRESNVPGFFLLAGIKSPGLTSAPAIAEDTVRYVGTRHELKEKKSFVDARRVIRFRELSEQDKRELVAREPSYGRVICRCETVTEGEILAALRSPIPPVSVNGVKRRVNAGMGRCQGGFCGPRVQEILATFYGISQKDVPLEEPNSYLLTGRTKEANDGNL